MTVGVQVGLNGVLGEYKKGQSHLVNTAKSSTSKMIQNCVVAYIFRRSFILINTFNIFSNLHQFILLTKKINKKENGLL